MHLTYLKPKPLEPFSEAPVSYGRGRVCMADWCDTIMHQWHEGAYCYVHERMGEVEERPVLRALEGRAWEQMAA